VIDGAQIAGSAPRAAPAQQIAGKSPVPRRPRKACIMKTPLVALLSATAAAAAVAQLSSPITPGAAPTVRADPANTVVERAQLRNDQDKVRADQDRLRSAREAHDDAAIRAAQAALRIDTETLRLDRERLADANSGESLKR
jgi:hypothetical protein